MCYFVQIDKNKIPISAIGALRGIFELQKCYEKYFSYFQDDFSAYKGNLLAYIQSTAPYFWLIYSRQNRLMGFVSLDNFIGNDNISYSAEITTCFIPQAWGGFTRYCAKFFLKYCFDQFGFEKIKAQIYPDNFRVKNFLKDCGFIYESTLKNETVRLNKRQDIEIYSLYRSYYYKNEVKYD